MTGMQITRLFVTAIVLLIGLYDLVALNVWGVSATVSRVVLGDATVTPAIPAAIFFVMGHLFWPQPRPCEVKK